MKTTPSAAVTMLNPRWKRPARSAGRVRAEGRHEGVGAGADSWAPSITARPAGKEMQPLACQGDHDTEHGGRRLQHDGGDGTGGETEQRTFQ